jgi:hypothetical protein
MSKTKEMRTITIPEKFTDCMGEPWDIAKGIDEVTGKQIMDKDIGLVGVLKLTIRKMPVKSGEDAERSLDLLRMFKTAKPGDTIEISQHDYSWLMSQLKEYAHSIWTAPDAAWVREWLTENIGKIENVPTE